MSCSLGTLECKTLYIAGAHIRAQSGSYAGEKGGEMTVDAGGQHVLERTAVLIDSEVSGCNLA